ncbi:uncharacterized protein LOC123498187 [Portunus trituberculatus]|uniref:uncharacterized protein LOC123498187 n=1 Tax=Portunus trituberculatus TaxID=210409 RepID=UPI001E1D1FCB|nr:uncharacterized protein LOC123498187 [Portunus trituberculatus]
MVLPVIKYRSILDEVINQKIVIIDYEKITRATRGEHFSRTGLCDFYMGRENIQAHSVAMISQKDSPLIPSLNTRIISMTEAGLYNYWNNKGIPNYSACEQVPTKITISSSLSFRQCWAIMVILAGGLVVGLFVLTMEGVGGAASYKTVSLHVETHLGPSCLLLWTEPLLHTTSLRLGLSLVTVPACREASSSSHAMEFSGPFCIWSSSVSWVVLVFVVLLEGNSALEAGWDADAAAAVRDVLLASSESDSSLVIIAENIVLAVMMTVEVRMASWMVVMVVVSDDPVFLAAFAQQAREGRLLVWATRLIVVSRRVPHSLYPLHQTLALTNSLLLVVDVAAGNARLSSESDLIVAMDRNQRHKMKEQPDPIAPAGVRVQFKGFMVTVLDYLSQGLNFSYTFKRPQDGAWGAKLQNGSFTGMLGQVYREEVHFGLGPFGINAARYEAVDFTWPVFFVNVRIFAGRGSPEVDPWGFLLPLAPWVWLVLLLFLLFLCAISFILSSKLSQKLGDNDKIFASRTLHFVSIMLRQSVSLGSGGWMWQRVVLGVWILMTMVLTRSYEGNLMSLLAVRYLPQPYQTLRDVVDDPSVVMVWHKQGAPIQSVMINQTCHRQDATSGVFYDVKETMKQGRLQEQLPFKYLSILDEVISQRTVIIDYVRITKATRSKYFSQTGRCDFYIGLENIQANPVALISQKDSPLIPPLNARIMSLTEAGLFHHWNNEGIANYSACERVPTKITISSSLSLRQCWAMMVVLEGGLAAGLVILGAEVILAGVLRH